MRALERSTGFSQNTALPARAAASMRSAWVVVGVQIRTASTSERAMHLERAIPVNAAFNPTAWRKASAAGACVSAIATSLACGDGRARCGHGSIRSVRPPEPQPRSCWFPPILELMFRTDVVIRINVSLPQEPDNGLRQHRSSTALPPPARRRTWPPPNLDVITIGRSSVDLYGQQVGGRLEDMALFSKAVGGCPANIAIGTARLGLKSGLITRVGDEQMGRFIREQMVREGVATAGHPHRSGAAHRPRHPRRSRRAHLPADLLPRELRRHGPRRERHRRGLRRLGRRRRRHRHAFLAREHRRRADEGDPHRQRARPQGRLRRRLPAEPLGPRSAMAPAKRATSRSDAVTAHLAPILPICDLIVGTEEELHIAGGSEDTLAAIRAIRAPLGGDDRLQARPDGLRRLSRRDPGLPRGGRQGSGLPGRGLQRARRGRCLHVRLPARLAAGEPLETACAYANACGAFAVSRLLCSPESPTLPELQHFLATAARTAPCATTRTLNHVHWATTRRRAGRTRCGPRDRSPRPVRGDGRGGRRAAGAHRRSSRCSPSRPRRGSRRPAGLRHAARRHLRPRGAVPRGRPSVLDRPPGRGAGLAAARFRGRRRSRLAARRMARRAHDQVPVLLPPGRSAGAEGAAGARALAPQRRRPHAVGRELLVEIICRQARTARADDRRKRARAPLRPRHQAGLVEARAAGGRRRLARHRRRRFAGNDPYCRGIVLLGLEAPEHELEAAFAVAARSPSSRALPSAARSSTRPPQLWLEGAIGDEAAIADMAARFERLVNAWRRARGLARAA